MRLFCKSNPRLKGNNLDFNLAVTYSALEGFALYITEVENGDEEIVYQDLDKNDVENDIYRIPVKRNVTEIIIRRASVYLKVCELQVFQGNI